MWWPSARIASSQRQRAELRRDEALAATRHLSADGPLRALVERYGLERPLITRDPFVALVGAIVQQQVSMSAAFAILQRVKRLCPRARLSAAGLLSVPPVRLRGAGLSRQKALYVRDLAECFASGRLSARKLRAMSDDEVIAATTQVKGIGRWTAEMLLIFCLERPDVWPIDDLGLRKAVRNLLAAPELPDNATMQRVGEPWRPYRTYASWYLWRSLEGGVMPGIGL